MGFLNIFDIKGIDQSKPNYSIDLASCVKLDNFTPSIKETNSTELMTPIQKCAKETTYLDVITGKNGRGLYQFWSYDGATSYVVSAWNNNLYKDGGSSAWSSIKSGLSSDNHFEFASYVRKESKDVVMIGTNGSDAMIKWNPADASVGAYHNKELGVGNKITGILTFTKNSITVTGSGTAFDTELSAGDMIRSAEKEMIYIRHNWGFLNLEVVYVLFEKEAIWYRVASVESATSLTIEDPFRGITVTAGTGTSEMQTAKMTGTVTFANGDATVTNDTAYFTSSTTPVGSWIRRNSTGRWYEVESITSTTELELRTTFKEDDGAGDAGMSEVSSASRVYRFIYLFDALGIQKMILGCNITDTEYSKWVHSKPGDPEDIPTLNFDHLPARKHITGISQLGNYLMIFSEFSYYVYKYVPDSDSFKRISSFEGVGCISSKTIKKIPRGVIFLSANGLYRLTLQRGLEKVSDKVQLELDGVGNDIKNSTYYASAQGRNTMPQAEVDSENGYYYLSYPLAETKNSYLLKWDYRKDKFYRRTLVYANSLCYIRVSGSAPQLYYITSNATGYAYKIDSQSLAGSDTAAGTIKFGVWGLPNTKTGEITNKSFNTLWVTIVKSSTSLAGTLTLNYYPNYSTTAVVSGARALTSLASAEVEMIPFPINQTAKFIQFELVDSGMTEGYGIVGISLDYDEGKIKGGL